MDNKAQGLSMTVIIVAVLALIVLVVLIVIFSGKMGIFGKEAGAQTDKFTGNKCEIPGTTRKCVIVCSGVETKGTFSDCTTPKTICCAT